MPENLINRTAIDLALIERGPTAAVLESLESDLSEAGRLDAVTYRLRNACS